MGQFATELSTRFSAGSAYRSFLLTLDRHGNVVSLAFDDGSVGWRERSPELKALGTSHLFFDPLDDGKEYFWLSWHNVEQSVMERLIGQEFAASDFQPYPEFRTRTVQQTLAARFPSSWGVMF
jgi:hypothetical protein